ncbi:MAG TPA: ABC transporter ATP-binding protein [Solirubrobacterales bacterium]|nr:ABC transporter ATP-binding protein [Solirubrobacterales bacterium]
MSQTLLNIQNLNKAYGETAVVRDVSLEIQEGEFVTMLGPSGSGKTTTLLSVAGFVAPDSGEIVLDGRDVSRVPPEARDIGFVFQSYALFPHMSVGKNVAFPLAMRGIKGKEAERRVAEILDVVELGAMADRYPKQLSGGQQQRVALARAMVFSPKLLLMDEPLGALDKRLRASLQYEIKRISTELNATVLYVTHDQEEAMAMSDRIAIFDQGEILQIGSPKDLFEEPTSAFVANFLGEANVIDGRLNQRGPHHFFVNGGTEVPLPGAQCDELGLTEGTDIAIAIRPERMSIELRERGGVASGDEPGVDGVLNEVVYLGTTVRYVVAAELGDLVVQVPAHSNGMPAGVGDNVRLSWRSEHCVLLRR